MNAYAVIGQVMDLLNHGTLNVSSIGGSFLRLHEVTDQSETTTGGVTVSLNTL